MPSAAPEAGAAPMPEAAPGQGAAPMPDAAIRYDVWSILCQPDNVVAMDPRVRAAGLAWAGRQDPWLKSPRSPTYGRASPEDTPICGASHEVNPMSPPSPLSPTSDPDGAHEANPIMAHPAQNELEAPGQEISPTEEAHEDNGDPTVGHPSPSSSYYSDDESGDSASPTECHIVLSAPITDDGDSPTDMPVPTMVPLPF